MRRPAALSSAVWSPNDIWTSSAVHLPAAVNETPQLRDAVTLLHANGHHMLVVSEPLAVARERIVGKTGGDVTSFRRLCGFKMLKSL